MVLYLQCGGLHVLKKIVYYSLFLPEVVAMKVNEKCLSLWRCFLCWSFI